ncbi:MAG: hydroxyacid dehydrogenase [Lachnospiraceae bacterium]|nr:hydroxyacid dehydrogenase [Candidatus Equihabitans merdae]
MRIAIMESLGISKEKMAACQAPFIAEGHEFVEYAKSTDEAVLVEEAKDADVMILANMPMPGSVIEKCGNLKFIDVAFTGVDHVGLDAAKAAGIAVSNASGYSNEAVAELALGMALSMMRNVRQVEDRVRSGGTKDGLVGCEIKGKTVGIVGLGNIGSRSATLFHALGANILASSRTVHAEVKDYITQTSLDDLLSRSDIVILHCPLTADTKGMINKEKLALMKKSAILINVARGPVVNSQDLADALKEGVIAGAALDVFDKEPPLNADDVLLSAPNTLLTPHVAFATEQSMELRADIVFESLRAWMDGKQINVIL